MFRKLITQNMSASDKTFFGIVLVMVLEKAIWTYLNLDHPVVQQWTCSWSAILVVALLGVLAHKLSKKTGIPDMWDKNISNRQRFLIPALFGIGVAVIGIGMSIAMKLPNIHVPFPFSVPVYTTGAIFLELLFHIIPVVLLVWLISNIILRQRGQVYVFWLVGILLCLWEPIMKIGGMPQMGLGTNTFVAGLLFMFIFAANIIPISLFRKYGLIAPIAFRLADYIIWHIIFPLIYF